MNPRDCQPWHVAFNIRLDEIVRASPDVPGWHDVWMRLTADSPDDERLRVYQAIRDSGVLPDEAGFHLVSWQVDAMASRIAETELGWIDERLDEIRREHGLEEFDRWRGPVPAEYQRLLEQSWAAWEKILVRFLHQFGEHDMARLFVADRNEYERRGRAGRRWFQGSDTDFDDDDPLWLEALLIQTARCIEGARGPGMLARLGCRHREQDGAWQVQVFVRSVEIMGGASGGEILAPEFRIDLDELRSLFDHVDSSGWDALGSDDTDEPHVWIRGRYEGQDVSLCVLACAPEDATPLKHIERQSRR